MFKLETNIFCEYIIDILLKISADRCTSVHDLWGNVQNSSAEKLVMTGLPTRKITIHNSRIFCLVFTAMRGAHLWSLKRRRGGKKMRVSKAGLLAPV